MIRKLFICALVLFCTWLMLAVVAFVVSLLFSNSVTGFITMFAPWAALFYFTYKAVSND